MRACAWCLLTCLAAAADTGYVMDDSTIRTAVAAWLADATWAELTYGHISTWETGGVTDMDKLFCASSLCACSYYCGTTAAASFNEDIGAWDTSGVTTMFWMFHSASAFNRDIGDWAVDSVTNMAYMFGSASAFNQDLGWCVDDGVNLNNAFGGTQCESTSCGVVQVPGGCAPTPAPTVSPLVADDSTIRTAVAAWLSDAAAAEAAYGHISTWETAGVTDMSWLFCGASTDHSGNGYCNTAAASFNEDIGAWDTSDVTSMYGMFVDALSFNRDIGGWAVDSVTDMSYMFAYASAFDQDLGWCVDDGVSLDRAFESTPCASTSCGVIQFADQSDCDVSHTGNVMVNWKIKQAVAAWLSDSASAEATYGHISTWDTSGVTNMYRLFCALSGWSYCNTAAASFDEDIGAWQTSGVTTMYEMFDQALSFNQPLSGWQVDKVTSMGNMFRDASAFDQDLDWCVDESVSLGNAFSGTPCESTSCGVIQGTCAPSPAPTTAPTVTPRTSSSSSGGSCANVAPIAGVAAAAALLLAIGAFCWYRRRKGPGSEPPKDQPEAMPTKDEEAAAVSPEAEESPQETEESPQETLAEEAPPPPPARSWSWRAEAEPEAEKTEETLAEVPPAPPAKGWFGRAEPQPEPTAPEPEEPPLSPFSALRAERERELKTLASP